MQRPTPLAVFKAFSPILMLYLFVYSQGLQLILKSDNCARSIEGVSLMKHSYKSFFEQDLFKCYQKCKVDNLCQSINFYKDRNFCLSAEQPNSVCTFYGRACSKCELMLHGQSMSIFVPFCLSSKSETTCCLTERHFLPYTAAWPYSARVNEI